MPFCSRCLIYQSRWSNDSLINLLCWKMDLSTASQFTEVQQQEPVDETPIAWWTFLTSPSYTLAAGMLCGIVVNFLSRNFPRQVPFHVNLPSFSLAGNSKMVLIVRTDLGMTKGKAAAQCAHAALGCYKKAVKSNAAALEAWEKTGQAKVFLNGTIQGIFLWPYLPWWWLLGLPIYYFHSFIYQVSFSFFSPLCTLMVPFLSLLFLCEIFISFRFAWRSTMRKPWWI